MKTFWLPLLLVAAVALPVRADPTPAPSTQATKGPPHRPLRQNVKGEVPSATDPELFEGYAKAPAFEVVPQKDKLTFFPCSQCHKFIPPNPQPRKLQAPHPAALNHGKGRIWCLNCHLVDERDSLRTIRDEKVDFNDAYLVCGQCHANRQKDWYFGAHGKRVATWQGKRTLFSCTHCHDPHDPTIKPREPSKVPAVRAGLQRMDHESDGPRVWERLLEQKSGDSP